MKGVLSTADYVIKGENMPRLKFIEMAKQFNADDIDDDVDSLPSKTSPGASSSTYAAATPSHDRPAASAPAARRRRESEPHARSA